VVLAAHGGDPARHRRPPGFVWSATVSLFPFVPVRLLDTNDHGSGVLRARLLSTVTVADVGPGPETNEAELVCYLAEAVWFPTALLPAEGAEWEAVDEGSARATLEDGGTRPRRRSTSTRTTGWSE
jgi:hypothetical protein